MELPGGFEPPTTPAAFHRGLCPLLAASRHAGHQKYRMAFLACHPRSGTPMPLELGRVLADATRHL